MVVLGLFIFLLRKPFEVKLLLSLYGISLLAGPFLLQWFFQAHDQMQWVGAASIVRQTGFAVLVFLVCHRGVPLAYLGLVECGSVLAVSAFCIYVTHWKMGFAWPWPALRIGALLGHMGEALAIGLAELAWAFMWYFSTVLLGLVFSGRTLGWFGASHRALMALHTFVWLYFFNLLPSIARCVGKPHEHLLKLMDQSVRFTAWTGLFVAAVLTVIAHDLLRSFTDGPTPLRATRFPFWSGCFRSPCSAGIIDTSSSPTDVKSLLYCTAFRPWWRWYWALRWCRYFAGWERPGRCWPPIS